MSGGAYLDHAATTPMTDAALAAWVDVARLRLGNSTGAHRDARRAREIVEESREVVAGVCGADPAEVVFTSGGTESDYLSLCGAVRRNGLSGGEVAASAIEHPAVGSVVDELGGRRLPVDRRGHVDLDALAAALDGGVRLVAIMAVNNETGVIQRMHDIAEVLERHGRNLVGWQSDMVQTVSWLDLVDVAAPVGAFALSAHKFGGPTGAGVAVIRRPYGVDGLVVGGGQERGRRGGTHAVAQIASMAAALRRCHDGRAERVARIRQGRDRLVRSLRAELDGVSITTDPESEVPPDDIAAGFAHLTIDGVASEALVVMLDQADVSVSAGSSCSSGAMVVSPVVAAMGAVNDRCGVVRMTLGESTTDGEIDVAIDVICQSVRQLRHRAAVLS